MNCSDAREQLSALLDRGAPAGLRGELTEHVDGCAECRAELERFAATGAVVHNGLAVCEAAAPAGYFEKLWPQINKRLEEEPQGRDAISMSSSESGKRGPGGPKNGSVAAEDTGLHDIRGLARNTLERRAQTQPGEAGEDLLAAGTPSAIGQVVLPKRSRQITAAEAAAGRRSVLPLIMGGVVVACLSAGAAVLVLKSMEPPAEPEIAANSVTVSKPGSDMIGGSGPADDDNTDDSDDADDPGTAAATKETAVDKPDEPPRVAPNKGNVRKPPGKPAGRKPGKNNKGNKPKKNHKPIANKPPKKNKPAAKRGGGKKDEIDQLLDVAAFGGSRTDDDTSSDSGKSDLPKKLSRSQVTSTLRKLNSRVQRCYHRLKQKGTVKIKLKINSSGHVGSAKATGKFAGTPTGKCVSDVVRRAKFPKFGGPSMSLSYPFLLI